MPACAQVRLARQSSESKLEPHATALMATPRLQKPKIPIFCRNFVMKQIPR
jgi:hypothetical protein